MICPKFRAALLTAPNGFDRMREGDAECAQLDCAWWLDTTEQCAIAVMAKQLCYIQDDLLTIKSTLQHLVVQVEKSEVDNGS